MIYFLFALFLFVTVVSLIAGIMLMLKNKPNKKLSNRLMMVRVIGQALTIGVIAIIYHYYKK